MLELLQCAAEIILCALFGHDTTLILKEHHRDASWEHCRTPIHVTIGPMPCGSNFSVTKTRDSTSEETFLQV